MNEVRPADFEYTRGTCVKRTYSTRLELNEVLPATTIVERIGAIVRTKGLEGINLPVSGFIEASTAQSSIQFTCDPNRVGNPRPNESKEITLQVVSEYQKRHGEAQHITNEIEDDFRALAGLAIGYYDYRNPDNQDNKVFSFEEALRRLPRTTDPCIVNEGIIWSARYRGPQNPGYYHEPGLMIQGSENNIAPVLQMASKLGQQRIVIERRGVETQVYQTN